MDFAALKSNISRWVNRPEIEQAIPTFIELTEADLNRRLGEAGVSGGQGRSTSQIQQEYALAPADLGRVQSLILADGGIRLKSLSREGFEALKAEDPDRTGQPEVFTLMGAEFRYYPAPDKTYAIELTYQKRLSAVSGSTPSNWLLAYHPDAYLYGSLVRAAEYLGGDARLTTWQGLYEAAVAGVIRASRHRRGEQRAGRYRADLPLGRTSALT